MVEGQAEHERYAHIALVGDVMAEDENKTERVQLLMSPSEVKAIDDWMFDNRIRTRAEAMRRLCQMGIALDTEAKDLDSQAKDLGDNAKNILLETLKVMTSADRSGYDAWAEHFVDFLGDVFQHHGFVDRLVGASGISKRSSKEDEVTTYKDALRLWLSEKHSELEAKKASAGS